MSGSPRPVSASQNGRRQSVLRNIVASYLTISVQLALGLVVTPLLLKGLGDERFGLLSVVIALAGYVGSLELGLGTATVRRVASEAAGDGRDLSNVVRTALVLYLVVGALGSAILLSVAVLLPRLLPDATGDASSARLALLAIGAGQVVALLLNTYPALLLGSGRGSILSYLGLGSSMVTGVVQVVAALTTHSLAAVAASGAVVAAANAVAVRALARRRVQGEVYEGRFCRSTALSLMGSGWRNAAIGLAATLAYGLDVTIAGSQVGLTAAAAYGVANRAAGSLVAVSSRLGEVLVPTFAHHGALDDKRTLLTLYQESVVAAWILCLPVGIAALGTAPELFRMWLGDPPAHAEDIFRVMIVSLLIAVPGSTAFLFLSGLDRLKAVVPTALASALVNLGLSLVLVQRVGLIGPALATLITALIYDCVVMPWFVARACDVRPSVMAAPWMFLLVPTAASCAVAVSSTGLGDSEAATLGRVTLTGSAFLITVLVTMGSQRRARYRGLVLRRQATPS